MQLLEGAGGNTEFYSDANRFSKLEYVERRCSLTRPSASFLISSGTPHTASAILPVIAANVSESPPILIAFLIASSKPSASAKQRIASGTVAWQVSLYW